jgi:rubredoxin
MSSDTPVGSPPDPDGSAKASSSAVDVERASELPPDGLANGAAGAAGEPAAFEDVADTLAVVTESSAGVALNPAESAAAAATAEPPADPPESDPETHRFECRSCGFVYDPQEGVRKLGIEAGTAFVALDPASFRCPVCRSRVGAFMDIGPRNKPSGFEENLNFGLGVNRLTPGQKNVLIFGGFALAFAFFLSLYSLR